MLRELLRTGEPFTYRQLEARLPISTHRLRVYCSYLKGQGAIRRVGTGQSAVWILDNPNALADYVHHGLRTKAKKKERPFDGLPVEQAAIRSRPELARVWA